MTDMPGVIGTWEGVRAALSDHRLSTLSFPDAMIASGLSKATAAQCAPLFSRHGDDHRHLRAVLSSAFTPRKVEQLRPVTRAIAQRLADGIAEGDGACEFVSAFAGPLPPEVFAILFGLPVADSDRLARWATDISLAFNVAMSPDEVATVERTATEMRAYGAERIAMARATPGDDLVTRLVEAEVDGVRLSDDDVIAMITGFVFAGAETTRRQLTAAILLLADHADDWDRMAADPALVPNAVEEILRVRGIVPGMTRRIEQPGDDLPDAGPLFLWFDDANHDPSRFDDPDAFVMARPDAHAHVTFGWGPHVCVGAGLARLELAESLRVLTERFAAPVVDEIGPAGGIVAPDWLRVTLVPR